LSFHPAILTPTQLRVLQRLSPFVTQAGFYLGGGTAVALHLGHRRSRDFDWFTSEPMADPLRLGQALREQGISFMTGQVEPGTLYGTIQRVRISFLEYRYPLLRPPIPWPAKGCVLASLDDLACMKLSALAQRGAKKDFLDVYALIRKHAPLSRLLRLYRRRYNVEDIAHLLYALSYFRDADRERTPRLLWPVDWREVKRLLIEEVKRVPLEVAE
jgi:hypothetical protein